MRAMLLSHSGQMKLLAVLALLAVTVTVTACKSPVTQLKEALAADDLESAIAIASKASDKLRLETGEMLRVWAAGQDCTKADQRAKAARAYCTAIELLPDRIDLYVALGDVALMARAAAKPGEGPDPLWAELFEQWQNAGAANPKLAASDDFLEACAKVAWASSDPTKNQGHDPDPSTRPEPPTGELDFGGHVMAAVEGILAGRPEAAIPHAEQAAAMEPGHPAVLALQAELGLVESVSAEKAASVPIMVHLSVWRLYPPHGEWVIVVGRSPGAEFITCYGLRASDLSIAWRIENCEDWSVSLSPSGRYLAFARPAPEGEPGDIVVYDTSTGESHVAVTTLAPVWGTAWAPDESAIAVSSYEGLVLTSRDGTTSRLAEQAERSEYGGTQRAAWNPAWFVGGGGIGVQDRHLDRMGALWVLDPATCSKRQVRLSIDGNHFIGEACWSADGQAVAVRTYLGEDFGHGISVAAANTDRINPLLAIIRSVHVWAYPVAWSPDGRHLLLTMSLARQPGEYEPYSWGRLWLWDRESGDMLVLPTPPGASRAAWGPDGGTIYYVDPAQRLLVKLQVDL